MIPVRLVSYPSVCVQLSNYSCSTWPVLDFVSGNVHIATFSYILSTISTTISTNFSASTSTTTTGILFDPFPACDLAWTLGQSHRMKHGESVLYLIPVLLVLYPMIYVQLTSYSCHACIIFAFVDSTAYITTTTTITTSATAADDIFTNPSLLADPERTSGSISWNETQGRQVISSTHSFVRIQRFAFHWTNHSCLTRLIFVFLSLQWLTLWKHCISNAREEFQTALKTRSYIWTKNSKLYWPLRSFICMLVLTFQMTNSSRFIGLLLVIRLDCF